MARDRCLNVGLQYKSVTVRLQLDDIAMYDKKKKKKKTQI